MAVFPDPIKPLAAAPRGVFDAVLRLNCENVTDLSPLDRSRLDHLVGQAFKACVIGNGEAFLLALDQDADYDSPNFRWFQARFPKFVYVDRIVVAQSARGRGYANRLYNNLFNFALAAGHRYITCEVNVVPPNSVSDALHGVLGFAELDRSRLESGKTVRYLFKRLEAEHRFGRA